MRRVDPVVRQGLRERTLALGTVLRFVECIDRLVGDERLQAVPSDGRAVPVPLEACQALLPLKESRCTISTRLICAQSRWLVLQSGLAEFGQPAFKLPRFRLRALRGLPGAHSRDKVERSGRLPCNVPQLGCGWAARPRVVPEGICHREDPAQRWRTV